MSLYMPSLAGVLMLAYVIDAMCLDPVVSVVAEVLVDGPLYERFLGIFTDLSVLRCSAVHCPTPVETVQLFWPASHVFNSPGEM